MKSAELSLRPLFRAWLMAIRPKTLAAGTVPVFVGTALAHGEGRFSALRAVAALLGALFLQIGTNLSNDYYDFKKGADTTERLGPMRVTQGGLLAPVAVFGAAAGCFGLAALVGLYLVAVGGWPILMIGLLSIFAGYGYTGGPYPLGYHGWGDFLVFVFFGVVAVGGSYYIQAGELAAASLMTAVPVGALATAILVVNNLRDAPTDATAGKRTLAVRLGERFTRAEYVLLISVAFGSPVLVWRLFDKPGALLALAALPLVVAPMRCVFRGSGAELNRALAETARLELVFGLLFSAGLWR